MRTLSADVQLTVPVNTRISYIDDKLAIIGPSGAKTISGEHAPLCESLLRACNGTTPLSEINVDSHEKVSAAAQALYEERILYPAEVLSPLDIDDRLMGLFESILLSHEHEEWETFVEEVQRQSIVIKGDTRLADKMASCLECVNWTVAVDEEASAADVILLLETPATTQRARSRTNTEWLRSDAVLLRVGAREEEISIGPFLTPSSQTCLDCLTMREKMNGQAMSHDYETLNHGVTPTTKTLQLVAEQMTVRAATAMIPPSLSGIVTTVRLPTLRSRQSQILGVPGCESCGR